MDWRKYADAIASIESAGSGGYSAIGPRHPSLGRALGRYQIMEANLAPWGQEALGRAVTPDEFLSNPDIQDTLFQHKFGGYVNQYGPEGAAQAWFAGPGGVGKTGRKDSLGTTVGAYTDKFNRAMGGGGSATMAGSAGNDTLGVPMQDEQQPQNFWQRIRERPEMMMAIGGALQNLGWRGSGDDTMRAANAMLLGRSAEAKAQKQQTRTAQWLAQMGRADLAEAVASGALDGRSAVALAYQQPKDDRTALQQNYEYATTVLGMDPDAARDWVRGGQSITMTNEGAIPQGYRAVRDEQGRIESLEPIPGGPKDTTANVQARTDQTQRAGVVVLSDISRVKEKIENAPWYSPTTGALGGMFAKVGGTDAFDVGALLRTIGGNIGFDRLQQMRDASPTGGALGAINQQELNLLMSVMGSLEQSQSEGQLMDNLNRLETIYTDVMRKASAYPNAAEFGFGGAAPIVNTQEMSLDDLSRHYGGN